MDENISEFEETLRNWLAEEDRFNGDLESITYLKKYSLKLETEVHKVRIFTFKMSDGIERRAIIGPEICCSDVEGVEKLTDESYTQAYVGWYHIEHHTRIGSMMTEFDSSAIEETYRERLEELWKIEDLAFSKEKYKNEDQVVLSFTGTIEGKDVKGVSDGSQEVVFSAEHPEYVLSAAYYFFASLVLATDTAPVVAE